MAIVMGFNTEKEMVETIKASNYLNKLTTPGPSIVKEEVKGFFGIPDLLVISNKSNNIVSCAFEVKKSNWKRAHYQAFRYKAFVNRSCVIMDNDRIKPAIKNIELFLRSNVGLMSIDESGEIFTHHQPHDEIPFSSQLTAKFQIFLANVVE